MISPNRAAYIQALSDAVLNITAEHAQYGSGCTGVIINIVFGQDVVSTTLLPRRGDATKQRPEDVKALLLMALEGIELLLDDEDMGTVVARGDGGRGAPS